MEAVISAESLGKRYNISRARQESYATLREELSAHARALSRRLLRPLTRPSSMQTDKSDEEFWALRDISFNIRQGERVGIIGRNGAGKSTLLKILSRITEPTLGKIEIRGRVASLLEVGTGFHPELSGRENIYLNGAILGMKRAEIKSKFDEIVSFAEVEQFLDTPVKRYSSGMYVRLAFAVAAHLDPDILIVDEVLAVGDRQFQDKCLGRLKSISESDGKTVVFVSHNMDALLRICSQGMYMEHGRLIYSGAMGVAVSKYLSSGSSQSSTHEVNGTTSRWGSGLVKITAFEMLDSNGSPVISLQSGENYEFVLTYSSESELPVSGVIASLSMADSRGATVLLVSSDFTNQHLSLDGKAGRISCLVKDFNLVAGDYTVTLFLGRVSGDVLDCLNDVVTKSVIGGDFFGSGHPGLPEHCKTLTRSTWSTMTCE